MVIDLGQKPLIASTSSNIPEQCILYFAMGRGAIRMYDIIKMFYQFDLKVVPHENKRMNYNPMKGGREDFRQALQKPLLKMY